jgi:folate-binding protein YgfZ
MMIPPSFTLVRVDGPDAGRHLQGQLACDVLALPTGEWRFGAYCQVDGRVQALFVIARAEPECYELLMPTELAAEVRTRLERFRLRARCTLSLTAVDIMATPSPGAIGYQGPGLAWWLRPVTEATPLPLPLWQRQLDLATPWLRAATSSQFLPQMLGLVELGAITLKKGCYPGQEIVARTHYLGRSKRHLARLTVLEGEAAAGMALERAGESQPCATVLEGDHSQALAVLAESVPAEAVLETSPGVAAARFSVCEAAVATKRDAAMNRGQRSEVGA